MEPYNRWPLLLIGIYVVFNFLCKKLYFSVRNLLVYILGHASFLWNGFLEITFGVKGYLTFSLNKFCLWVSMAAESYQSKTVTFYS